MRWARGWSLESVAHARCDLGEIEVPLVGEQTEPTHVGTDGEAPPQPDVETAPYRQGESGFGPVNIWSGQNDRAE